MLPSSRKTLVGATLFAATAVVFLLVSLFRAEEKRLARREDVQPRHLVGDPASGTRPPSFEADDGDESGPPELLSVTGSVRDEVGAPVGDVQVSFSGDDGDVATVTGKDGRYGIALAPGNYRARAIGDDVVGASSQGLDLKAGSAGGSVDFVVGRFATISGEVKDSRGKPVGAAVVTFETLVRVGRVRSEDLDERGTAETTPDGRFSLRVAPGPVRVTAARSGVRARAFLDAVQPGSDREVNITMPLVGEVAGKVVGPDRIPVFANVVAVSTGDTVETTTDGAGRFLLLVPVGTISLQATASGALAPSSPTRMHVSEEGVRDLEIVLSPGTTIAGKVLDPDGNAVEGAVVSARGRSSVDAREVQTDADGAFTVSGLGKGPVELVARKAPFVAARLAGVVPPKSGLELELLRTAAIVGVVQTADGKPIADFTFRIDHFMDGLRRVSGSPNPARRLAPDGRFELRGLHPGVYEIVFGAPGMAAVRKTGITVDQMETADLVVVLAPGGTIVGRVIDARDARPLPGARVIAEAGSPEGSTVTGAEGEFALRNVAAGRRTLTVTKAGFLKALAPDVDLAAGGQSSVVVRLSPGDAKSQ